MSTPPKSILVHLDSSPRTAERLRIAVDLAEHFDAHVHALPCILSAYERYPYGMDLSGAALSTLEELDHQAMRRTRETFGQIVGASGRLRWLSPEGSTPWAFAQRALTHDLVIVGQRNPSDAHVQDLPIGFLSDVIIEGGRPTLVVPYAGNFNPVGQRILIAWKPSKEAARAVSSAIPWMRLAAGVDLVSYSEDRAYGLQALRDYLHAHGIHSSMHYAGPEIRDVGPCLLSLAADLGAGLLVMGCWGHSRFREWVAGGTTHSILNSMTIPVLMVH